MTNDADERPIQVNQDKARIPEALPGKTAISLVSRETDHQGDVFALHHDRDVCPRKRSAAH